MADLAPPIYRQVGEIVSPTLNQYLKGNIQCGLVIIPIYVCISQNVVHRNKKCEQKLKKQLLTAIYGKR